MIKRILVVCLGNICRSPMAEGLFRQALPNAQLSSAGIGAMVGYGADPLAVQIMAEKGIDITAHRARQLSDALVREADLIFVMDEQQKQQLTAQYAYLRGKVFRLGEMSKQDIPDPYKQGTEAFLTSFSMIEIAVRIWVKRINSIA